MTEEYEYDDDRDGVVCPRCMGDGSVDCHCGGDLCVCENYGERDCPICHGEGEISEIRNNLYNESRRQAHEAMHRVWSQTEGTEPAPSQAGISAPSAEMNTKPARQALKGRAG